MIGTEEKFNEKPNSFYDNIFKAKPFQVFLKKNKQISLTNKLENSFHSICNKNQKRFSKKTR